MYLEIWVLILCVAMLAVVGGLLGVVIVYVIERGMEKDKPKDESK